MAWVPMSSGRVYGKQLLAVTEAPCGPSTNCPAYDADVIVSPSDALVLGIATEFDPLPPAKPTSPFESQSAPSSRRPSRSAALDLLVAHLPGLPRSVSPWALRLALVPFAIAIGCLCWELAPTPDAPAT